MRLAGRLLAVTGVGGFIGLRVAEIARARGHRVRGLELQPDAARRAEDAGVEVIVGDVSDPAAARALCRGAGAVVHAAAIVQESGARAAFDRVNVHGTVRVANAAAEAGARCFVHLSSVMVYGFHYPPAVTEAGPLVGDGHPYNETKIASEAALAGLARPGRFDVRVLRPGDVYGPGSVPWVVRPLELWRRHLFALPEGGRGILNPIYVDDLVDAIFLVLERDDATGPYNVTDGHAVTCRDFYERLGRLVGHRGVPTLPAVVLQGLARLVQRGAAAVGRSPPFAPEAVAFLLRPNAVSSQRLFGELGFVPATPLPRGLAQTAAWYLARPEARI